MNSPHNTHKLRSFLLEDRELVTMLRGAKKKPLKGRRSDQPHSGVWSKTESYVLVPTKSSVPRRVASISNFMSKHNLAFTNRSSDAEVLILAPHNNIYTLITTGPLFCRAQKKRTQRPEAAHHLLKPQSNETVAPTINDRPPDDWEPI